MRPLLELQEGQLLQSGLYPNLAPNQPAIWREGENVHFFDGRVQKMDGWLERRTYGANINALAQARVDTDRRVYVGLPTELHLYNDGTNTRLKTGASAGRWSMEPWGAWLIATNGINAPQVWKNGAADSAVALGDFIYNYAKIIKKLANHVLAYNLGVTDGGQMVAWCDQSDPETWTTTDENTAGFILIRDLDGKIMAAENFSKDVIAFATENTVGVSEYIGAPFYFSHKPRLTGIGAVGLNAMCEANGKLYGVSRAGIWTSDLYTFEYITDPAINKFLEETVDWQKGEEVTTFHNLQRRLIEFWFTDLDGNRRGVAYRYAPDPAWTKLRANLTAGAPRSVLDTAIAGIGNTLVLWGRGPDAGELNALSFSLQSAPFDGGARQRMKRWDMLEVDVEGTGTVEVRFGFSDTPKGAIEWTAWAALAPENYIDRDSAYLSVGFRGTAVGVTWALGGAVLHGEITGYI